jgi:hypothetical protein
VKTARNVVPKRLSATAERYTVYFNFVFLFAVMKTREVRIRTVITSRLQENITCSSTLHAKLLIMYN